MAGEAGARSAENAETRRSVEPRPAVEFLSSIRLHPYVKELEARLRLACEPCAECGHIDWSELDDLLDAPE